MACVGLIFFQIKQLGLKVLKIAKSRSISSPACAGILLAIGNRTGTDSNWKCPIMAMVRHTECPIEFSTQWQNVRSLIHPNKNPDVQTTLWMYVKFIHNLVRFEALLDAYSVQIWSGFAKSFSSYHVTTAKSGQFQALQGQMTLKI